MCFICCYHVYPIQVTYTLLRDCIAYLSVGDGTHSIQLCIILLHVLDNPRFGSIFLNMVYLPVVTMHKL